MHLQFEVSIYLNYACISQPKLKHKHKFFSGFLFKRGFVHDTMFPLALKTLSNGGN